MQYPQIYQAEAVNDTTLVVEFTNHEVKEYNICYLLDNPMFAPLKQPAFFKSFQVESGGYGIVWNEDIDISEYELWTKGVSLVKDQDRVEEKAL
jgi:hypothetical protein